MPNYYPNYGYPNNNSYGQPNQNSYGVNQPMQSYGTPNNYSYGNSYGGSYGNSYGNVPMNYSGGTPMPSSNNGIIWVQGEAGAKAYPVAAGTTVMLMDSESSTFYIKQTDERGFPMPLEIYDYNKRQNPNLQLTSGGSNMSGMQNNNYNNGSSGNVIDAQVMQQDYVTKTEFDELKKMIEEMNNNMKHSNSSGQSNYKGNKNG